MVRNFRQPLQFWSCRVTGSVDHDSDIRVAGKLQGYMLEFQVPQREVLYDFVTIHRASSIVVRPPLTKFGASRFEVLNQLFEPDVPRIANAGCVKLCQDTSCCLFPIGIVRPGD